MATSLDDYLDREFTPEQPTPAATPTLEDQAKARMAPINAANKAAEVVAPVAPKPDTMGMGPWELGAEGAKTALINKYRGVTGQDELPTTQKLMQNPEARWGAVVPELGASLAVRAKAVPQMIVSGLSAAAEPGSAMQRLQRGAEGALMGGLGQFLGAGLVKGNNAILGNLTPAGQAAKAAKAEGLDLTAGDILNSNMLRKAEEFTLNSPSEKQAQQVTKLMTAQGGDPISGAINRAYDTATGNVKNAAAKLDSLIAADPKLPKVVPYDTYAAIKDLAQNSPHTLDLVKNPNIRAKLDEIVNYPPGRIPKGMTITDLNELRKAIGPYQYAVKKASRSESVPGIIPDDSKLWDTVYSKINKDIEDWGTKAATQDVLDAHKNVIDTFKNEVLPLREHPIAEKVIYDKYTRPEDIARDVINPRNTSIIRDDLMPRLDEAGRKTLEGLKMAPRGMREFGYNGGEQKAGWIKPLSMTVGGAGAGAGAMALGVNPWIPAALLAEQLGVHGMNTGVGKAIASGSPVISPLEAVNRIGYAVPRTALPQAGLEAIRQRTK